VAEVFCNNCGHRNALGSNFCSSCGKALEGRAADSTVTFQLDALTDDEVRVELDDVPAEGVLVVTRGPNAGSRFALDKPVTTVGRHPESDIFLDDVTVSRRHVEVERTADGFVARDVGSLNGTYLNREPMEEAPVRNGDELQVGKFKLVFFEGHQAGS
jgi:pSer/pThr/pTyr-binding forkhead associated (FHA) protein